MEKAKFDVKNYVDRISRDDLVNAQRLFSAVHDTCELISEIPEAGSIQSFKDPKLAHLRMLPVRGFKTYLIFYIPKDEYIEIVRVLHAARNIEGLFTDEN